MATAVLLGLLLAFEPKEPGGHGAASPRLADGGPDAAAGDADLLVGAPLLAGSFGLFEWELSQGELL